MSGAKLRCLVPITALRSLPHQFLEAVVCFVPQGILPDAPHLAHIVTATLAQGLIVRQVPTN